MTFLTLYNPSADVFGVTWYTKDGCWSFVRLYMKTLSPSAKVKWYLFWMPDIVITRSKDLSALSSISSAVCLLIPLKTCTRSLPFLTGSRPNLVLFLTALLPWAKPPSQMLWPWCGANTLSSIRTYQSVTPSTASVNLPHASLPAGQWHTMHVSSWSALAHHQTISWC